MTIPVSLAPHEDPEAIEKAKEIAKASKQEKTKECRNCFATIAPHRCSRCKSAYYCSAQCQKLHYKFHKRECETKLESDLPSSCTENDNPDKKISQKTSTTKIEKVTASDSDDEKFDWYRHREWVPENKVEFLPEKIEAVPEAVETTTASSVSKWNSAKTFEQRDVVNQAENLLRKRFEPGKSFDLTVKTHGYVCCSDLKIREGEANIIIVRGTPRYLFEYNFDLTFSWARPENPEREFTVFVTDFNQTGVPVVQPKLKGNNARDVWDELSRDITVLILRELEEFKNDFFNL